MRFRLIYSGPLRSSQRTVLPGSVDSKAAHKHEIRRQFHSQLKQLWANTRFLANYTATPEEYLSEAPLADGILRWPDSGQRSPILELIAEKYQNFGYRFVPLVTAHWELHCRVSILLLRPVHAGGLFGTAGDLDNKVKTLIDALRMPRHDNELTGTKPSPDENPFFCLMEDDVLMTSLSVETDVLLTFPMAKSDAAKLNAHAVVTVEVLPSAATMRNMGFYS